MTFGCTRVLIVDDENALLFSLSDYLTFRGCRVDCAEELSEAQALVHHLHYDAVVVGVNALNLQAARMLAAEARSRLPMARLVALAHENQADAENRGELGPFDQVFARHLPIVQLARVLCRSIAA